MAHVVWKHMGIRMNDMEMRMSGATISMAEWAALVVGPACKHYHAKRNDRRRKGLSHGKGIVRLRG